MARRIVPCLDIKEGRVVKGVRFVDLEARELDVVIGSTLWAHAEVSHRDVVDGNAELAEIHGATPEDVARGVDEAFAESPVVIHGAFRLPSAAHLG